MEFDTLFEIENTVKVIIDQNAKNVALQFSDELLHVADRITQSLRRHLSEDVNLFILGDTPVRPCCVDTVALEHVAADLVIHYGDACLSVIERIPVYYVYERREFDIESFMEAVKAKFDGCNETIYLAYDLSYTYIIEEVYRRMKAVCPNVVLGETNRSQNLSTSLSVAENAIHLGYHYFSGGSSTVQSGDIVLFIAKDGIDPSDTYHNGNMYSVLLDSGLAFSYVYTDNTIITINPNKFLMQRYVCIERFEHVHLFGIVIETLSVHHYASIMNKIQALAEQHDQVAYPIIVGKMNVPKLGNFPGMEGFVLVGCERSCFTDCREYSTPIITPYEYMVSIKEREWEAVYKRDYVDLLNEEDLKDLKDLKDEGSEAEVTHEENQLIVFNSEMLDYINTQHYYGLEQQQNVKPAMLKKGLNGIASCYEKELF